MYDVADTLGSACLTSLRLDGHFCAVADTLGNVCLTTLCSGQGERPEPEAEEEGRTILLGLYVLRLIPSTRQANVMYARIF